MLWNTSIAKIEIVETCFLKKKKHREPNKRINPFEELTGVSNRCYSMRFQKLITDFGTEESFGLAAQRMKEHHGVEINVSSARIITEYHASRAASIESTLPSKVKQPSTQMIVEMDGEMVPVVEYILSKDRRKTKTNLWQELRIGTAQNAGETSWQYACSFQDTDQLGDRLKAVVIRLGYTEQTKVHGPGDGASWITTQGERIAGTNYSHLIDLFHLCEYFSGAVLAWQENTRPEVIRLKELAKEGKINKVVEELRERQKTFPDYENIQSCIKYIENRPGQFEYQEAIKKELPIGSGKVESTHRSLMQKRLKKPGAWWLRENAAKIADLRTLRANGGWEFLWQQDSKMNPVQAAA
jgi:hypothetical protein